MGGVGGVYWGMGGWGILGYGGGGEYWGMGGVGISYMISYMISSFLPKHEILRIGLAWRANRSHTLYEYFALYQALPSAI